MNNSDTSNDPEQTYDYLVKLFFPLSMEEHRRFLDARDALLTFRSNSRLYRIVQWNYQDYYSTLNIYLEAYANNNDGYLEAFPSRLGINRCLLNFLSSIRTFLDHTETSISRRHGESSENFVKFKRCCSDAYDGSFSYRFLYELRNYSQHCGLPIDSIHFKTDLNPKNLGKPFSTLGVGVTRDQLLEGFKWRKLRPEIIQQPPIIDINSHINVVMRLVEGINTSVSSDEMPLLIEKAMFIKELADRVGSYSEYRNGTPYVFELSDDARELKPDRGMRIVSVPLEIALPIIQGEIDEII